MTELPFDLLKANRWFAIECNNQAWDLVEAEERSDDQLEKMLHIAHTARYHWQHAGTEINWLRAEVLLSTAYSVAKRAENALVYAESASQLLGQAKEVTSFDQASVSGAHAFALSVANNSAEAKEMHGKFVHDLSMVEEAEELKLLEKLYGSCLE
jgi:hypothetical protein